MLSEDYLVEQLNAPTKQERLMAITGLKKLMDDGFLEKPVKGEDINNHIHTTYSFSPYSPSKAALARVYGRLMHSRNNGP